MDDPLEAKLLNIRERKKQLAEEEAALTKEFEQRELRKANAELILKHAKLQDALKGSLELEADEMRKALRIFDENLVKAKEHFRLECVNNIKNSKAALNVTRDELESDLLKTNKLMRDTGIEIETPTLDSGPKPPDDGHFTLTATALRVEESPQSLQGSQRPRTQRPSENALAPNSAPQRQDNRSLGTRLSAESPDATLIADFDDDAEANDPASTFLSEFPTVISYKGGYRELHCPVTSCRRNTSSKGWFKGRRGLLKHIQALHAPIHYFMTQCTAHIFDAADCERLRRGESPVSRVPTPRYEPLSEEDATWMSGSPNATELATASASGAPPTAAPKGAARTPEADTAQATTAAVPRVVTAPTKKAPVSRTSDATSATNATATTATAANLAYKTPAVRTVSNNQPQSQSAAEATPTSKKDGEITEDDKLTKSPDATRNSQTQQPERFQAPTAVMMTTVQRPSLGLPPAPRTSLPRTPFVAMSHGTSSIGRADPHDPRAQARARAIARRSENLDGPSGRLSSASHHTPQSSDPLPSSHRPSGRLESRSYQDLRGNGRRDSTLPVTPAAIVGGGSRGGGVGSRGDSRQPSQDRRNGATSQGGHYNRNSEGSDRRSSGYQQQ